MAILMNDDIFTCEDCKEKEFTMQDVFSFIYEEDNGVKTLFRNTTRKKITCINCGKTYELSNKLKLDK